MPARTRPKGVSYYPSLGNLRVPPSGMEDGVEDGKRANVDAYRTDQPKEVQFEKQVDPISARATGEPEQGPTVRNRELRNAPIKEALKEAEQREEGLKAERETAKEELKQVIEEGGKPAPEPVEETPKAEGEPAKTFDADARKAELEGMQESDLRARAFDLNVENQDQMDKDALVAAILAAESK